MPRSAWLLATVIAGAALVSPPGASSLFGVASAEAAQGYHTRRRVRGRWVTGRFRSGGAAAEQADATPAASSVEATAAPPTVTVGGPRARRVRFTERRGLAKTRYSSLPKVQARVVLRSQVPPSAAVPAPAVPAAAPAGVASSPDRVFATASINPVLIPQPEAERMRPALEAKARSMASELGLVAMAPPAPPATVQLPARSVTFDLAAGTRTVVFEDGASVTAPFDQGRAEGMTGLSAPR